MTVSKVSPGNAKAAKLNVKSAPAKARVEAAAEAKLLADAALAGERHASPMGDAEGAGGNAALILGGIAVLGGLAAAAAGGGGGDDITVTPAPVTVTPAPTPPPATYALAAGGTSVNEGSTAIFTLTTTNVTAGSPVAYTISGVSADDVVGGKLTGNATVGADGKALIEVQLVADALTEGAETLTVTAGGKTASVSVADTSLTPAAVAKSFTLTAGVDTMVGAATDDTFTADNTGANVTSLADSLDGGAGTDKLTIYGFDAASDALPQLANIENVVLDNSASSATAVSLVNATGLASVTVQAAAGATNTSVASGVAVTLKANANTASAQVVNYGATATSGSLTLNGVSTTTGVDVEVVGAKLATLNLATAGAASSVGQLEVGAATAKVVVTGDQNLTIVDAVESAVDVIDASAFTGKLSVATANEAVTHNDTAVGGTVDLVDITVNGGSANDTINLSANAADNELLVDAGAGDDTVTIGATLGNAATATAGDVLKGGAGTDVLVADIDLVDAAAIGTALTGVSGFETLNLSGVWDDASVLNVAKVSADITRVNVSTASGAFNHTINFAAGSSTLGVNADAAIAASQTLTVDAAGDGTSDALTVTNMLTSGQIASATSNLTVTDYETVTINTGSYTTAAAQLINVVNIGANTLVLTGSNGVTTTATNGIITAKVIDASGLGAALVMGAAASGLTTLTGSAKADTLKGDASSTINGGAGNDDIAGGSGVDTINGDDGNDAINGGGGADTIHGNAGDDTITLNGSTASVYGDDGDDTVVAAGNLAYGVAVAGGAGTDTLEVNAGVSAADASVVTGFETLKLATTGSIALANFGNNTFTKVSVGATTAATTSVSGVSGQTISVTDVLGGDLTVALASTSGTSDTQAIEFKSATGITATNEVIVAGVETVNLSLTDTTTASADVNTVQLTVAAATTLNVSGNQGVTFAGSGDIAAVTTFDASGVVLGAVTGTGVTYAATYNLVGGSTTITGSNGVDTLTGGSNTNDTIRGGSGADTIVYTGGSDTVTGGAGIDKFDMNADGTSAAHLVITDLSKDDQIDVADVDDGTLAVANGALGAKVTLGAAATFQNYLDNAASNTTDANTNNVLDQSIAKWFQFDGNTYMVIDNSVNATFTAGTDSVVKISGLVDLSASTFATSVLTYVIA